MAISGDVFRINQVYELLQEGQWPLEFFTRSESSTGYFSGGFPSSSLIRRLDFNNDSITTVGVGNLTHSISWTSSTGNSDYGWVGGGDPITSIVNRITYTSDTSSASLRGYLSVARAYPASTGNQTNGWFASGVTGPSTTTTIERITYITDTSNLGIRGNLPVGKIRYHAAGNSNYGWYVGGINNSLTPVYSSVDRIDYNSDTSTASIRGPLNASRYYLGFTGNSDYGWVGGGTTVTNGTSPLSTVSRITYNNDTVSTSQRGNLSVQRRGLVATGTSSYGWFGGGYGTSIVERIDYQNDSNSASRVGDLNNTGNQGMSAVGGFPG
jgi:hypothetical protein